MENNQYGCQSQESACETYVMGYNKPTDGHLWEIHDAILATEEHQPLKKVLKKHTTKKEENPKSKKL